MKSVKLAAVSSLFAVLAFSLAGCTAEVVPNEPAGVTARATTIPGGGNGGGEAGNQQVVGTSRMHNGAPITPWTEPLPNPWHGGPVEGIASEGILPNVETPSEPPGVPPTGPTPHVHRAAEDPDVERYNGPKGALPW